MTDDFAWLPDEQTVRRARLTEFIDSNDCTDFDDLQRRSVEDVAWFTERLLEFLDVRFQRPYESVLDTSRGPEWPVWCIGAELNIAATCVDKHLGTGLEHQPAIIWEGEEGQQRSLTYRELHDQVQLCSGGLRALGLSKGDPVGMHLPMVPETVVALLALARIGAIAVPVFSGYGPAAIESRLNAVEAKALITADGFPRRGRNVDSKSIADDAISRSPTVRHVIVVNRVDSTETLASDRDVTWESLMAKGQAAASALRELEPTSAEDPLLVIYTSGTTGRPKGIAHSHCGFPIKAAQDMAFGTDVGPGTRIAWVTDIGWMMGPWLIYGATILGATIVLYDGAPDYPEADRLWKFSAEHGVEVLGISPTLIRALLVHGDALPARHDLSALRIFASTGEPWNPDPWQWLFEKVGHSKVPIINYSGGTEISGGILMGNPLLPIKPCAFSAPCPGIAADVVNEQGESVRNQVGELVIRKPWIGQARGFWKDPERYLDTYWSRMPGVWVHGDWCLVDDDGQWFILGRSDDTMKVAGKRVGPAEVESILTANHDVVESAVIGIPDEVKGTAMVAFCVLRAGVDASARIEGELRDSVGHELGKPLRPERIHFVSALPRTRNGKIMRRVARAAYTGEDPGDLSALENPGSIEEISRLKR